MLVSHAPTESGHAVLFTFDRCCERGQRSLQGNHRLVAGRERTPITRRRLPLQRRRTPAADMDRIARRWHPTGSH
jgi:hypothetical protein